MIETTPGHTYLLQNNKDLGAQELRFYMDPGIHNGQHQAGTTNQEVLRAVIARLRSINEEAPWGGNALIIQHLQAAIMLHEIRAATRKGVCSLATATDLQRRADALGGIEKLTPRQTDSHIYDPAVHLAADCGGKCFS